MVQKKKKSPGKYDDEGGYYLEEVDFLKWLSKRLRAKACMSEGGRLRTEADNISIKSAMQITKLRETADGFDKAAKRYNEENGDFVTELSKKYNIDFKNPNVTFDDESGKITLIDPEQSFPRLKEE